MGIASKTKRELLRISENNCWYCGDANPSTIDHIVALDNGGSDDIENLVLCCKRCNSRKKAMTIEEFRYKNSWEKTEYSNVINHYTARKLIDQGVIFEGFCNNHIFWFEVKYGK